MRNFISSVIARHRFHKTFPRRGTQLRVFFSQLLIPFMLEKGSDDFDCAKSKHATLFETNNQFHAIRKLIICNSINLPCLTRRICASFACYNRVTRSQAIFSSAVTKEVWTKVPRYGLKQKGH